jgi:hypothetical protein
LDKTGDWYKDRFIYSSTKVHKNCLFCNRDLYLPLSKSHDRNTCGRSCSNQLSKKTIEQRKRNCLECGSEFVPRKIQLTKRQGKYCSVACCNKNSQHLLNPESIKKSQESRKVNLKNGKWKPVSGENHYAWKGGEEARKLRNKLSGKRAEATRKYRKNNPDKVREFTLRRKGKIVGRLQRGTVNKIGEAQKWKCPVCKTSIKQNYHVDHIVALASGGKHEKDNIQQ